MEPADYLLLIGELHGCSQHLQKLGQKADREVIQRMIIKFTRIYNALDK